LADKPAAVREASGDEAAALSRTAVAFAIENKALLGNDRELAALAVAGILSLPADNVDSLTQEEKDGICDDFLNLYTLFDDTTVKIAVLNRIAVLKLPEDRFTELLNEFMKKAKPASENGALLKAVVSALGDVGNQDSFVILCQLLNDSAWSEFAPEIASAAGGLLEQSLPQAVSLIQKGTAADCRKIFDLAVQNGAIPYSFKAHIAENVLSRAIYIAENSRSAGREVVSLQMDSFRALESWKWTRAAQTALRFFDAAKAEFDAKSLSENDFTAVISGIAALAPMGAPQALSAYLMQLNKLKEANLPGPADPVVLAVISSLGAIGDKSAFDSLLAVTYYNYSDAVIAEARNALARLKW
ncbi:MAG: hypothetical protein K2H09_06895, partial [Treponemataceae bacterium]|nr:hypothetical protein [Treponemataceae bacterium]